ncbi:MAG: aldehyde dehydrogenase family protein [Desulfarculus sp.]|nr:MAG: aldehyde dehydrogenase family protein [Desulfarculus sp.]
MQTEPARTTCLDPATGQVLGYSPLDDPAQVPELVAAARQAQPAWADTPVHLRVRALRRVGDYITDHAQELAQTIASDNGKTRLDALVTEVIAAAMAVDYYARKAGCFLAERSLRPASLLLANKRSRILRQPYGVIAVISPWNYPFAIPFSEVVMGLLAGNAVILKAASETQMVGRALEQCLAAAGLPAGVFTYLNLPGRVAGQALLQAGVNKLFFTGSTAVGKQLMAQAAQSLTPLNLELGGNDAMLVCPDADLERAAAGAAWAGFSNCGQSCAGVERIYVHQDVYQPFLDLLADRVRALRVGPDRDHQVELGAMTTTSQMDKVRLHLEDALARGANIYAESQPAPEQGNFMPARVLTGVNHQMLVMREETFGPLVAVMPVVEMDQAVELANDSDLGLTGSVWSRDRRAARSLARRIQAGVVTINDHLMSHGLAEAPWGGFKQSGIGRSHGEIGFAEMTQPQCIVDDILSGAKRDMWWHPYSAGLYHGLGGILEFLYGRGLGRRLAGLGRLSKILPRTFRR